MDSNGVFTEDDFLRLEDPYLNKVEDGELNEEEIRDMIYFYKGYEKDRHEAYV